MLIHVEIHVDVDYSITIPDGLVFSGESFFEEQSSRTYQGWLSLEQFEEFALRERLHATNSIQRPVVGVLDAPAWFRGKIVTGVGFSRMFGETFEERHAPLTVNALCFWERGDPTELRNGSYFSKFQDETTARVMKMMVKHLVPWSLSNREEIYTEEELRQLEESEAKDK